MRLAVAFCVFQVFAICAAAQDPMQAKQPPDRPATVASPLRVQATLRGPADLRLTGPAEVVLGQAVTLSVEGLPAVDLGQTVGQQTAWIDALRFELDAPIGADPEMIKELSMGVSPWVWRLRVSWTPEVAGVYLLICDWNEPPYGLAVHRVTVRDPRPPPVTPPPLPTPDPTVPPSPTTGVAYVIVIRHNADLTADQTATLLHLRTWSDSRPSQISHLEISPDAGAGDSRLAGYTAMAASLPWVIVSRSRTDGRGASVLSSGPLPATAQELIARVEEVVK